MFEFLKECDSKMYDAAKEIEDLIHHKIVFGSMRKLVEYVLNTLYVSYGNDLYDVNLNSLLRNNEFISQVSKCIKFNDFETIDSICRLGGNHALHISLKHDFDKTPEDAKRGIKCVYDFACCYYKYITKKSAPKWSETEYNRLLDNAPDPKAREKLKISEEKIRLLERECFVAKADAREATKATQVLIDEIEELKRGSIDPDVLSEYDDKIKDLEGKINTIEAERIILHRQLDVAEKDKKQYRDELNSKNKKLHEDLKKIQNEREQLIQKLSELENASVDVNELRILTEKLNIANKEESEAKKKLKQLTDEVESLKDKLYLSKGQADAVYRKYQNAQRELSELWDKNSQLLSDINAIEKAIEEDDGPICPNCKSSLIPKRSKDGTGLFWACPSYKTDGTGCSGLTRGITPNELSVANRLLEMLEQQKSDWDQYNNIQLQQKRLQSQRFYIDKEQIERLQKKYIVFNRYPISVEGSVPNTFWFQSLSVPSELFEEREALSLSYFSRFKMISNLASKSIVGNYRTIYSLTLKLLNRGVVLPEFKRNEEILRNKFNKKPIGTVKSIFDSIEYHAPINNYKNDAEKEFAETIFPEIMGLSWATYVQVHTFMDVLLPEDDWNKFIGQDVVFVFFTNGKKIVIDIDNTNDTIQRDNTLKYYGYEVLHFNSKDLEKNKIDIINTIHETIGEKKSVEKEIDCDKRLAVACKLVHQMAITLAKSLEQGMIDEHSNIKVYGSTELFSQSELQFLLTLAGEEIISIVNNYGKIYKITNDLDFFDKDKEPITIYIGEGKTDADILIRDMYVPYNYLCPIEPFSLNIMPKKADKRALEFFLNYIYGFEEFRDGQIPAIGRILTQKDTIVLLPTGAGKSIIYQLASFILPGMVVVVSPLNSLIEDQLSNLEEKGGINNVVSITSQNSATTVQKYVVSALMSHNSTALLYISPERMQIPTFRDSVKDLLINNNVCAVAIDEAHCVSEWGHDFRAAYLNIGKTARTLFKKGNYTPSILALTGTASDAVLSDVQCDLEILSDGDLILPESFDRPELSFDVISCDASNKTNTIASLLKNKLPNCFGKSYDEFAKRNGKDTTPGIIFTPLAAPSRPTEYDALSMSGRLEGMLPEMGIGCYFTTPPTGYTKESWDVTIRENAKHFKSNDSNVIVATKAYGMGIDKNNIRFVIHDGLPVSIEQYYQEVGRAGRDRKRSKCILVFSNDNETINEELLNPALSIDELLEKYKDYSEQTRKDGRDDLSSVLFFHTGNFKGIDKENEIVDRIIGLISASNPQANTTIMQNILKEEGQSKEDAQNEWIRAIIRLSILGVVKDYTYDYNANFQITFGSFDKKDIIDNYKDYVIKNARGKERAEVEKLSISSLEGWEFIRFAVKTLIEYVYDTIEKNRRAALRSMFNLAKQTLNQPEEYRNEFIRNEILQYLTIEKKTKDDLELILDSPDIGWDEIERILPFVVDEVNDSGEDAEKCQKLKGAAGRMIESHADHPGLLMLRAIAEIKSEKYEEGLVANDISAAINFALKKYSMDIESCKSILIKVLNLALNSSETLFEKTLSQIQKIDTFENVNMFDEMATSEFVSAENRDYIVLCLVSNNLNERL